MFIEVSEKEDAKTGKKKTSETVIFPRYHQLDVIRKLLESVYGNRTSLNYLLQHSKDYTPDGAPDATWDVGGTLTALEDDGLNAGTFPLESFWHDGGSHDAEDVD